MALDPSIITRLDELLSAIRNYGDPRRAAEEWKQVYKLLQKTEVPAGKVTAVVGMRDAAGLGHLIDELRSTGAVVAEERPSEEICRQALKVFRKRRALTKLDDESKLGHSPLSKGSDARLAPITAPVEFPQSVWQELVRQGKLRYLGQGFYDLPKGQG
jgi:hypothetical protein